MCEALTLLLDNAFIKVGSKLCRQIVGIPMGTNCAPLEADLFLFCYERDLILSLSDGYRSEVIEDFNYISISGYRYISDLVVHGLFYRKTQCKIWCSEC